MGCTPSFQVSQGGGVIYCQDSDDSQSSYRATNLLSNSGIAGRFKSGNITVDTSPEVVEATADPQAATMRAIRSGLTLPCLSNSRQTSEAETQTSKINTPLRENREVQFGSMKLKLSPMKILLVFGSEDAQSDAFWWAADKLKNHCNMARTAEMALEYYLKMRHDLIIIDNRHSKYFDAESLCRTLRTTKDSEHTVMVAVVKKSAVDKEEATVLPLLKSGFNRCFIECPNLGVCLNELLQLETTEVTTRHLLRASMSLFVALDRCRDAVEITNADNEIEYVNVACEKILGYNSEELLGKNIREIHRNDHLKVDLFDAINLQLNKGKDWEGTIFNKRKQGESIPLICHATPVITQGRRTEHLVYVKEYPIFWDKSNELLNGKEPSHISALDISPYTRGNLRSGRKGSYDIRSLKSEGFNRRQSMAKTYSMTIEAPITQVINLITNLQDDCPIHIAQGLDKALEMLRRTELYSPQLFEFAGNVRTDDRSANDFLRGLLSQGPRPSSGFRRCSNESSVAKGFSPSPTLSVSSILANTPSNIKTLLENESRWDFDILSLERITERRPLVYLGMSIFHRFDAFSHLNCNETTLQNWLSVIEANYHQKNTYHNSTHAADVLQATAYFLRREKMKELIDPLDAVACLIAAVVHDVDHPGKTSAFLSNKRDKLAILYNDLSVLESHHSAMAFELTLSDERVNIFHHVDRDTYHVLRQTVIDMVLATEMTKHFEHLAKFVNAWRKPVAQDDKLISGEATRESIDASSLATPENLVLVKRMIIKCADISNPVRPLSLCVEWSKRIGEEYFTQTDEEKALGLPVCMAQFDREKCNIPNAQKTFIDIFIRNMFEELDGFAGVPEIVENLQLNYQYWEDQEARMDNNRVVQQPPNRDCSEKGHNGRA